ncbi:MAG: phosphate ABC transporter permease subunit PstC [Cetobacterium sp.]|uniref:phosphate ABC transporter permease subunit PstC n=1 Tax=unclassified Cetobacterium TaxID=2630983 RepID=UPI00163CBE0D|nr:phosphate ABC transporter permease subunit PstC [Cetobacterium sp. 2A]MBC2855935.1 phosphate ABC transporter permease subunit PstC [Cetobacterium sp. 2A]
MLFLRKLKDTLMRIFHSVIGIFNIVIVLLIFIFIFLNSIKFFEEYPMSKFFFGTQWISLSDKYGILPLLVGSFWVTAVALVISVPIGVFSALYLSEYASKKTRNYFKILIETMSALPSVVLGFIGLYALSGPIKELFNLQSGLNALTGGIMLSFMAIPTIVSLSDDALKALDHSYKEASLALGANKLETIFKILLPAAFPGIFAGIMLGFGRIIGETMAVLMITGNAPIMATSPLSPVRTLTATIAAEMGEVVQGSVHYHALFAIGLVLFTISFLTNSIADKYIRKSRKLMGK